MKFVEAPSSDPVSSTLSLISQDDWLIIGFAVVALILFAGLLSRGRKGRNRHSDWNDGGWHNDGDGGGGD